MDATSTNPAGCPRRDGPPPSCAQPLTLDAALARFRHEAVWSTCATGRYRCPYVLWGRGPALIFIPGLCDDPWSFVLPMSRLSARYLCVAYAMPTGQGDGACLDRYTQPDLVADLHALCDHLGLDQALLLGVSFGATVALKALHDRPARYPRAVLQGGFARRPLAWAEIMLASWARWWPGPLAALPLRRRLLGRYQRPTFAGRPPDVWDYFVEHDGRQPIAAVAHKALWLERTDLRPLLPTIRQPVLLVCGERDPLVGKACERELLAGLPRAARAEIEGAGHLPQYTHPEVLCEVIEQFLA